MSEKKPKIFISHSTKDRDYVEKFVNLLEGMSLNQNHIFCSSLPGYSVEIDKNIFDYLREQFEEYKLHVFVIHSANYYESTVSLNEMGAAWVLRNDCTSILLPGFDFSKMSGVVDARTIALKLDTDEMDIKDKLNQIYDSLVKEFDLSRLSDVLWEQKRNKFINEIKEICQTKNIKDAPISNKADAPGLYEKDAPRFNEEDTPILNEETSHISTEALNILSAASQDEGDSIFLIRIREGTIIQTEKGAKTVSGREAAEIESALKELIEQGYIAKRDNKGERFTVTDKGYKFIDSYYDN